MTRRMKQWDKKQTGIAALLRIMNDSKVLWAK